MSDKLQRITGNESLRRYFDTDYLGACNFDAGAEPILTIESLWRGDLTLGGGRKEQHVVIKFREKKAPGVDELKPFILNATNLRTLKKLYGDDSASALEGKRIRLYVDPKVRDPQDGGFTEGLRIKPYIPPVNGVETCEDCGEEVAAAGGMSAAQVLAYSKNRFKAFLCADCMHKRNAAAKAAKAAAEENIDPSAGTGSVENGMDTVADVSADSANDTAAFENDQAKNDESEVTPE